MAPRRRGGIAPTHSWHRHQMEVSGQRHAAAALYRRYPLVRRLGGSQSWSRHKVYRKNPLPLSGIEPRQSSVQSNTTLTELSGDNY
jgi:hypothetical protein